jgi:hypothetical protein
VEPKDHSTIHYTELQPFRDGGPLTVEWDLYRREVGRWLGEGLEGRWVLIKDEEVIGFFDTRDAAMDAAYKRYLIPRQPFLVHQILTRERLLRVNRFLRPNPCPTPPSQ